MRIFINVMVTTLFFTFMAYAQDKPPDISNLPTDMTYDVMSHKQKMEMHEQVLEMQKIMAALKEEKNLKKREVLMTQHMEGLLKGIHMMNQGLGNMDLEDKKLNQNHDEVSTIRSRLWMTQMMLQQMIEHNMEKGERHKLNLEKIR